MKANYEARIRELNEDLQSRTRNLQRVERQNLSLQEKNIRLNNSLQSTEVQQLSTVAGSGSNQRDIAASLNRRPVEELEEEEQNAGQNRRGPVRNVSNL